MSFALVRSRVSIIRSRRRGLTLLELLVALAIVLAFMSAVVLVFIQVLRTNERAVARMDALNNARHALETMSLELKAARTGPPPLATLFVGARADTAVGNRVNEDFDTGATDEETPDGLDNDADYVAVPHDRHVVIVDLPTTSIRERNAFVGVPDLGDARVDEDNRFSSSTVTFRTFPPFYEPSVGARRVRFSVEEFDGEPNVLVREVTSNEGASDQQTTRSAMAYNVLSFDALYWDPNRQADGRKRWLSVWNADAVTTGPVLPPSVYLSVTTYAGPVPRSILSSQAPLDTVTLNTVVNIESALTDPRYTVLRDTY